MSGIAENLEILRKKIAGACDLAGRGLETVDLIVVGKTFPALDLREVAKLGAIDFGENYIREAELKVSELSDLRLNWHMIGHLQSNKAVLASRIFDWIHTVDSVRLAEKLSKSRVGKPPLNICLQINIDEESSKSGIPPREAKILAHEVSTLPNLNLRGLMTIPSRRHEDKRIPYRRLRELKSEIGLPLDTLSMGMTEDYESAIAEGATHIRVGRAIFGERT